MNNQVYISIVVPVFNEQECLLELHEMLHEVLEGIERPYEIIFVDDGSKDRTPDILKEIGAQDKHVCVLSFCRNFGQHSAVIAGFKNVSGQVVITLDADLQNPPSEIPKLLKKIEEGYDVVSGRRIDRKDNIFRKLPSLIMNMIISNLTGVKLHDYGCMLRAYRREIADYVAQYGDKSVYIPAFASWLSSNVIEIPVIHNSRKYGRSKYNLLKFLRQVFDLVTTYTLLPIQLISITGVIFSAMGIFLALYLISFRLFFGTTSPLTTFISALLFFSGIIIFFMGVISEYLARIYIETKKIPLYILKKESGKNSEK